MRRYVVDTNVWLNAWQIMNRLSDGKIYVPMTVIRELDHQRHQTEKGNLKYMARQSITFMEGLHKDIESNVILYDNSHIKLPEHIYSSPYSINDDIIIETIKYLKSNEPDFEWILVTNDLAMRLVAESYNINTMQLTEECIVDNNYSGVIELILPDDVINELYAMDTFNPCRYEEIIEANDNKDFIFNAFYELTSGTNKKKKLLCYYNCDTKMFDKLNDKSKYSSFGKITPLNKEQMYYMHLLKNTNIPCIQIKGGAGTGKTVLSISYALGEVMEGRYNKFMYIKTLDPVSGKDIGYLPGSKEEKLQPHLAPLYDSLEFLMDCSRQQAIAELETLELQGKFEMEAISHMRGRSFHKTLLIIDEAENLDIPSFKTILTRAGKDSRIIILSDDEQIDNPKVSSLTNGTSLLKERLVGEKLYGYVELPNSVRSPFTELAIKLMKS